VNKPTVRIVFHAFSPAFLIVSAQIQRFQLQKVKMAKVISPSYHEGEAPYNTALDHVGRDMPHGHPDQGLVGSVSL
jgi:hypothetical protein